MVFNITADSWAGPDSTFNGNSTFTESSTFGGNATFGSNTTFAGNETDFTALPPLQIPPNPGRPLQADVVVCSILTFLIASTFVGLRFYTRGYVSRLLGWSDWFILLALLCSAGVTVSALEQMVNGAGKHWWEFDPFKFPYFQRAAWYGILFYNLSLSFSRISILLLYRRIFKYDWIKRAIQIVLVGVTALFIWFLISVCTACIPLEAFWDWSLYWTTYVYCQPVNLWWANAALHIASDLVIMALPLPVLSSLNLPRRQKYAVVGLFALGFFACVISVVRLTYLVTVTNEAWQSYDGSYISARMIFWTTIEVNAAISCACIMTLKPLIQRVFPRLLSPSRDRREPALQWITPIQNESVCDGTDNPTNNNPNNNDTNNDNSTHHHLLLLPEKRASSCSPTSASFPVTPLTPTHYPRRGSAPALYPVRSRTGSIGGGNLPHLPEHHHRAAADDHHDDALESSRYYHGFTAPTAVAARKLSVGGASGGGDGEYDLDKDLDLEAQRVFGGEYYLEEEEDEKGAGPSSSTTNTATTTSTAVAGVTVGVAGSGGDCDHGGNARRASSDGGSRNSFEPGSPADSATTMVSGENGIGNGEGGSLSAPPRAHLRGPSVS